MHLRHATHISIPFEYAVQSTGWGGAGPRRYVGVNNFGFSTGVSTAALETVWPGTGVYPFPAAAFTPEIVSDSTNDRSTGTGARTVVVEGLGADYSTRSETVTLIAQATTTPVPTTFATTGWLRVQRAYVATAGSGAGNAGKLSVRPSGGGSAYAVIRAGDNQTKQAIYTVPAGYSGFLMQQAVSAQAPISGSIKTGSGQFEFRVRDTTDGVFRLQQKHPIQDGQDHSYLMPNRYPAKTDMRYDAIAYSSDVDLGVEFSILLEPTS